MKERQGRLARAEPATGSVAAPAGGLVRAATTTRANDVAKSVKKAAKAAKAAAGAAQAARAGKAASAVRTIGKTTRAASVASATKQSAPAALGQVLPHAARRPGRPGGRANEGAQRSRLLDAALVLFARQGIADTTLAVIAREAGVTPAMVHYYFHTRDQLIDVLIDEYLVPLRATLIDAFDAHADDPVSALTEFALRLIRLGEAQPWFAPLWVREVISEGGLLRQRVRERFGSAHRQAAHARIVRWQKQGRLNAALEPSLLVQSLLGLTILPFAMAHPWFDAPAHKRKHEQIGADEIARHAVALITHGVTPATRDSSGARGGKRKGK